MIEIKILIDANNEEKDIIFNSILLENIDNKSVSINKEKAEIVIRANTLNKGRAIMNSYISWIYTIMETIKKVSKNDRKNSS
ncbi:KEOPS complex subunit Pcc1 [Sulfurisphaera javensis]|uniref:KEOPS complex subunit Pcc1 n=1 Tax=Sulfurisphaera javensis TaxID=2049879 RepID=A0AAT9GS30_9CREN